MLYTILGASFPVPGDSAWPNAAIWPGNNPDQNIGYDQAAKANRKLLEANDIFIPKNLHAYRQAAARDMDDQGMSDTV